MASVGTDAALTSTPQSDEQAWRRARAAYELLGSGGMGEEADITGDLVSAIVNAVADRRSRGSTRHQLV